MHQTRDHKPNPSQRKILVAMSNGQALERRQPIRLNKPRYWTLESRKIAEASPAACLKAGWIEAVHVAQGHGSRWSTLYTLTDLGRQAIKHGDPQ